MSQLYLFNSESGALSADKTARSPTPMPPPATKRPRKMVIHLELDELTSKKVHASLLRQVRKLDARANIVIENLPAHKPWYDLPFLCVDTETSGLDRAVHRVIEVAWVRFEQQRETLADSRLCSIGEPLPAEIVQLTGIHDGMLEGQPAFALHADELIRAMSKVSFIVAYNANFDKLFLEAEMRRIGKTMPDLPWVDPYTFIKEIDRYQKGKKLSDASARWGVELKDAHRALADAKATGLLLYKLAPHLKTESLTNLIKMQDAWAQEQERSFKAYLARKQNQLTPP